jgi:4-alpha-glucanotransferase
MGGLRKRASGILMHITSLPSKYGIGDFGPVAYEFADFLKKAGQSYWQLLPLNYTTAKTYYSPYNCFSAFAGNPLLISPELLYRDGLIQKNELDNIPAPPLVHQRRSDRVKYTYVSSYKYKLLNTALQRFTGPSMFNDFDDFVRNNEFWLEDFAVFVSLKRKLDNRHWCEWPKEIRNRSKQALKLVQRELKDDIKRQIFLQYIFYRQYSCLKSYCEKLGINIIGDIPIYVAYDSADVWTHPEMFKMTQARKPRYIAGVPPDYFSRTGQLWGNPVYNWQYLERTDFAWWMERIKHNLGLYDLVRIDHFRGLIAYWQVPAGQKTATRGKWVEVPKDRFFATLFKRFPFAPIFVEDLGYITVDVREMIKKYSFPCIKVLQFGFDSDPKSNPHSPHNHIENSIVYTGTHDNNTTRGWFENEATPEQKKRLFNYLGRRISGKDIHWEMIRLAMASVSKVVVIPMQDVLGLPAEARMNNPARAKGNWLWQMCPNKATRQLADRLKKMVETYGRDLNSLNAD